MSITFTEANHAPGNIELRYLGYVKLRLTIDNGRLSEKSILPVCMSSIEVKDNLKLEYNTASTTNIVMVLHVTPRPSQTTKPIRSSCVKRSVA